MDVRTAGESALVGWRASVGARVAEPVARRTGVDADLVRAGMGLAFFAVSLLYVVRTVMRMLRRP